MRKLPKGAFFFGTMLKDFLQKKFNLSDLAWQALELKLVYKQYEKNAFVLKENSVSNFMYFIEKGCVRAFYNTEEKEQTTWFALENDFFCSYYSFLTSSVSAENIQCLEDCTFVGISQDNLYELYSQHIEIEKMGRIIGEQYYIRLEERLIHIQYQSARDRYSWLLNNKPFLFQRINLGYISSYLGISQETLSRIRAQKIL